MHDVDRVGFHKFADDPTLSKLGGKMNDKSCGGVRQSPRKKSAEAMQPLVQRCVFDEAQPVEIIGEQRR